MRLLHLQPSTYRQMKWKNGLGVTTEIARAPHDGDFDWRVSTARVATDGPFSIFPGCDRVIVTIEGAGMILTHEDHGASVTLALLDPWAFSGDWLTSCVLRDGPIRDFNVIARRDSYRPSVSVLRPAGPERVELSAAMTLLYCARGALTVGVESALELTHDETLIVEQTSRGEHLLIQPSEPETIVIQADLFHRNQV